MRCWDRLMLDVPVDDCEMTVGVVCPLRVERYPHRDSQARSEEEDRKFCLPHGKPAKSSKQPSNPHLLNLHRPSKAQECDHIKNWLVWILPGKAGLHDSVSVG